MDLRSNEQIIRESECPDTPEAALLKLELDGIIREIEEVSRSREDVQLEITELMAAIDSTEDAINTLQTEIDQYNATLESWDERERQFLLERASTLQDLRAASQVC